MTEEKFSAILRGKEFNQFAALLAVPFRSYRWRHQHPECPFWALWENCVKWLKDQYFVQKSSRTEFLNAFTDLIGAIIHVDPKLFYREEDMAWLIKVLDGERALVTMSMLFAYSAAKDSYLTPVQVAEITLTSESSWRNKAASGDLLGAFKAGKQWLIPVPALRAYGLDIEMRGRDVDVDEENDSE